MLFCGICFFAYGIFLSYDSPSTFPAKFEWFSYIMQFVCFSIILFGLVLIANALLYFDDLLIIENEIIYLDSEKGVQLKIKEIEKVEISKLEQETKLLIHYKDGRKTDILEKYKIEKSDQKVFWGKVGINLKTD